MKQFRILILSEAQEDLRRAKEYYKGISTVLAKRFIEAAKEALLNIKAQPFSYSLLYENVRSHKLNTFPYSYHFVVREQLIIITGLYHHAQNPESWIR